MNRSEFCSHHQSLPDTRSRLPISYYRGLLVEGELPRHIPGSRVDPDLVVFAFSERNNSLAGTADTHRLEGNGRTHIPLLEVATVIFTRRDQSFEEVWRQIEVEERRSLGLQANGTPFRSEILLTSSKVA